MYGWVQAIDEAMVTTHLGTAESSDSYDTAKRKLGELIDWHVAVALDERVNGGWRLVPLEPTQDMVDAFNNNQMFRYNPNSEAEYKGRHSWKAMILAAPKP